VDLAIDLAYDQGRAPDRHATELETALYRIVQEALTNATKHGGMQERAELLHGSLGIEASPGQGTTVNAVFPVQRRSAARALDQRLGRDHRRVTRRRA
jgi:signal transduction histidine kinase